MSCWYVSYAKKIGKGWLCWVTNAESGRTFLRGDSRDPNLEATMWEFCEYLNRRAP